MTLKHIVLTLAGAAILGQAGVAAAATTAPVNPAASLSLAPTARTGAPSGKKSHLVGPALIIALVAAAAVAGGVAAATSGGGHHSDSN